MIAPTAQGIHFLGYRVFPTHPLLAKRNVHRFRRRLRRILADHARGEIAPEVVRARIMSWIGHARQADTWRLRERLLSEHPFRGAAAG